MCAPNAYQVAAKHNFIIFTFLSKISIYSHDRNALPRILASVSEIDQAIGMVVILGLILGSALAGVIGGYVFGRLFGRYM